MWYHNTALFELNGYIKTEVHLKKEMIKIEVTRVCLEDQSWPIAQQQTRVETWLEGGTLLPWVQNMSTKVAILDWIGPQKILKIEGGWVDFMIGFL